MLFNIRIKARSDHFSVSFIYYLSKRLQNTTKRSSTKSGAAALIFVYFIFSLQKALLLPRTGTGKPAPESSNGM